MGFTYLPIKLYSRTCRDGIVLLFYFQSSPISSPTKHIKETRETSFSGIETSFPHVETSYTALKASRHLVSICSTNVSHYHSRLSQTPVTRPTDLLLAFSSQAAITPTATTHKPSNIKVLNTRQATRNQRSVRSVSQKATPLTKKVLRRKETSIKTLTTKHVSQRENIANRHLRHVKTLRFMCFIMLEHVKTAATPPISLYFVIFAANDWQTYRSSKE